MLRRKKKRKKTNGKRKRIKRKGTRRRRKVKENGGRGSTRRGPEGGVRGRRTGGGGRRGSSCVPASVVLPEASQHRPYINSSTYLSPGHGTVYGPARHYTYCLHCIYILNSGRVAATWATPRRLPHPAALLPLFTHVELYGGEQETTCYYDTNDPLHQGINVLKAQGFR